MEQIENIFAMLELMDRPAFCVSGGTISYVNTAAARFLIAPETPVESILFTGKQEYREFQGGCLYLTLCIAGQQHGASVSRMGDMDVFALDQNNHHAELQAMALAAQELRHPLAGTMAVADRLFPVIATSEDAALQEQVARMNRGLFQMLRIIGNMSDAYHYSEEHTPLLETRDICAVINDIFQAQATLIQHTGIELHYSVPEVPIYCLADEEKLERAISNILSNAVKFSPRGSRIEAQLTRKGNMLYLSIQDGGNGIQENLRANIYSRYQRSPGIEDSRFGIGLGMVMIRSAAAAHGGTVLTDQPTQQGTRITMTMAICQSSTTVRSTTLHVDYAGEWNHRLIELSEVLPPELYRREKRN